jgi:hypothetical protein
MLLSTSRLDDLRSNLRLAFLTALRLFGALTFTVTGTNQNDTSWSVFLFLLMVEVVTISSSPWGCHCLE